MEIKGRKKQSRYVTFRQMDIGECFYHSKYTGDEEELCMKVDSDKYFNIEQNRLFTTGMEHREWKESTVICEIEVLED